MDYMKESLRLLNENIDLNADLVRCRLKLKQAESEVERLQKVYAITNESWKKQVEELALLRKLAQATWEYFNDPEIINDADIEDALAEYEAWKESQHD